jgi:hypothetical protein
LKDIYLKQIFSYFYPFKYTIFTDKNLFFEKKKNEEELLQIKLKILKHNFFSFYAINNKKW